MANTFRPTNKKVFETAKSLLQLKDPRVSFTDISDTEAHINGVTVDTKYAVVNFISGCAYKEGPILCLDPKRIPTFNVDNGEYYYSGPAYSCEQEVNFKIVQVPAGWIVCEKENGQWFRYCDGYKTFEGAVIYLMGWIK